MTSTKKRQKIENKKMMPKKKKTADWILEKIKRPYLSYVKYLLEKKSPEKWVYMPSQENLNKAIIFPGVDPKFKDFTIKDLSTVFIQEELAEK